MPSNPRLPMVWLLLFGTLLSAQTPAASRAKQKSATPAPAKEQLYTLHGRVIASGIEKPVDSALITFRSSTKYTDDVFSNTKGEFEIELPPGDYSYEAKVYGYELDNTLLHEFTIAAGKKIEPLTVRMLREAEISGVVEDADGHPLGDVLVEAHNASRITEARAGKTRADGTFSIPLVLPGSYLIRAVMVAPVENATSTFVTTYYPGTTESSMAEELTLNGADRSGLRLRMQRAELHSVSGRVTGSGANLRGADSVFLLPVEDSRVGISLAGRLAQAVSGGRSDIGEDGTFGISQVSPGRYTVEVQDRRRTGIPLAMQQITVGDRDVENLKMAVMPAGTFAGKFVAENGKLPKELDRPTLVGQTAGGRVSATFVVKKDGSFSIDGVPNGTYALPLSTLAGYSVSSVEVGGQTYAGSKFPFSAAGSKDVVIRLNAGGALIQGTLVGAGDPARPMGGTATATQVSGLTDGLPYLRKATIARSGVFTLIDLEPGTYLVCAWSDYSPRTDRLLNSDKLPVERLQQLCKTVELKKDSAESIEVRLTSLAEFAR